MDDFLEQMLSTAQWGGDSSSMIRSWGPSTTADGVSVDTIGGAGMELPKLTQAYHLHGGHAGAFDTQTLGSHGLSPQENTGQSQNQYSFRPVPSARQPFNPSSQSLMRGDQKFERSGFQHTFPLTTPTWHRPYAGGVPSLPSTFGPTGKSENLGKRCRAGGDEEEDDDEEASNMGPNAAPQDFQSGQPFGSQSPLVPPNLGTVDGKGAARPRVRARRGQATDPHSIAERHRRERIAERMKALQELVPDANKTDKASMLDEIIGYVRFLQMQVKCLSVCRLGAAGTGTPLFADLPGEGGSNLMEATVGQLKGSSSQENMAYAEHQVATLMDEDMSAAMQYLQSKGLCLMPISLATAISTTTATPLSLGKPFSPQLPMPSNNNNNNMPTKQVGESLTRDGGNSNALEFSPPNDGFSSREDLT